MDVTRGEVVEAELDRMIARRSLRETDPDERKRWEGYVAARTEAESTERKLGHAMSFGLMRPPELDGNFGGSPAAMRG